MQLSQSCLTARTSLPIFNNMFRLGILVLMTLRMTVCPLLCAYGIDPQDQCCAKCSHSINTCDTACSDSANSHSDNRKSPSKSQNDRQPCSQNCACKIVLAKSHRMDSSNVVLTPFESNATWSQTAIKTFRSSFQQNQSACSLWNTGKSLRITQSSLLI